MSRIPTRDDAIREPMAGDYGMSILPIPAGSGPLERARFTMKPDAWCWCADMHGKPHRSGSVGCVFERKVESNAHQKD